MAIVVAIAVYLIVGLAKDSADIGTIRSILADGHLKSCSDNRFQPAGATQCIKLQKKVFGNQTVSIKD